MSDQDTRDALRRYGLIGIVSNDEGMGSAGKAMVHSADEQELEDFRQRAEDDRNARYLMGLDAADKRAAMRASSLLGRWQLKKVPGADGSKWVKFNPMTNEVMTDAETDNLNSQSQATVGPKAKQDAAALEAAANRIEALAKTATPRMFSPTGDTIKELVSHIPLIGDVASNAVKSNFSKEHQQFLEQETSANALVRRALEGGYGTDESRRIMRDAYPYTPGTTYEQFQTNAPAFVEHLRGMAAAKRSANYNPDTGTGGQAPPPMRGIPSGGIPPLSSPGVDRSSGGSTPSAGTGQTPGEPVYERRNGKLVRVQ
jgi:hypothetical protein